MNTRRSSGSIEAREQRNMAKRMNIAQEFYLFIRENKAYWMVPPVVVLLLLALVIILGSTSVAPFIYTLF
jgi:hypothetical protein